MIFEKIDAGLLSLHIESVHPASFVRNSMRIFDIHAKSNRVLLELSSDLPSSLSSTDNIFEVLEEDEVLCDKYAVSQVIRNFISNAIKFTPQGGRVIVHVCFEHIPAPPSISPGGGGGGDDGGGGCEQKGFVLDVNGEVDAIPGKCNIKEQVDIMHGRLRVSVTDSGVGISTEDQSKLFKGVVQFRPEVEMC